MAKKRSPQPKTTPQGAADAYPVVGAREPCPCNSGRRYKACHGRAAAHAVTELVQRPFEGLPGEADWVALRELVPAATVELHLKEGLPDGVPSVTLATVLPMAWPALRRDDGAVLIGLQNDTTSGDLSRDLASTLRRALTAEPGTPVAAGDAPGAGRAPADGPRLQDLLDLDRPFEPVVHQGFEFWIEDAENASAEVTASLERANEAAIPTVRLTGVESAYWCETPDKNHLRWVMTHPEEKLLDALARLHAAGRLVPRARPDGAGVGPADRDARGRRGEAHRAVRGAARRRARDRGAADARRAPRAQRAHQPSGHPELTPTGPPGPARAHLSPGTGSRGAGRRPGGSARGGATGARDPARGWGAAYGQMAVAGGRPKPCANNLMVPHGYSIPPWPRHTRHSGEVPPRYETVVPGERGWGCIRLL